MQDPHLSQLLEELEQIDGHIREWVEQLPEERIAASAADGGWGVGSCIEHLRITTDEYLPSIHARIEKSRSQNLTRANGYRPTWLGNLFLKALDGKRTLKAPKTFRPSPQPTNRGRASLEEFLTQQNRLRQAIGDADGLNLNRGKLPSPITGLIRFTLGDAFTILVTHQRRHLGQAQRALGSK